VQEGVLVGRSPRVMADIFPRYTSVKLVWSIFLRLLCVCVRDPDGVSVVVQLQAKPTMLRGAGIMLGAARVECVR
jgi:hypothetical protein